MCVRSMCGVWGHSTPSQGHASALPVGSLQRQCYAVSAQTHAFPSRSQMLFLAASFFFFLPHPFDGDGGELVFSSIVNLQNPFTPFGGLFSSFTTKLGQA